MEENKKETPSINDEYMPFQKSTSFGRAFNLMKTVSVVMIIASVAIVLGALFFTSQVTKQANQKAYFVSNAGAVAGKLITSKDERKVEVKAHLEKFMKLMFSFDQGNFESNIDKALYLIGDDGKLIYKGYLDNNMSGTLIKNNAVIGIEIDSIRINPEMSEPYEAAIYARQTVSTSLGYAEQFRHAFVELRNVSRTEENVHGLMITSFNTINADPVPESMIDPNKLR